MQQFQKPLKPSSALSNKMNKKTSNKKIKKGITKSEFVLKREKLKTLKIEADKRLALPNPPDSRLVANKQRRKRTIQENKHESEFLGFRPIGVGTYFKKNHRLIA